MKLFISEPEERHQGPILVHDEALNDIAEFYHNELHTVDTSYETALALAKTVVNHGDLVKALERVTANIDWLYKNVKGDYLPDHDCIVQARKILAAAKECDHAM